MTDSDGADQIRQAPGSPAEQIPAGFSWRRVRVDDVNIEYVIGGNGPTLVLVHGYPQSWYEWRHLLPALAEHYTVIAPSLRGAGRSDAPPNGYDKKTLAGDVHGLLVQIGHDKDIRLVGHDIGLMVAYSYAAAHPEFPHESTTDQWFGESQLESYRLLGLHAVEVICGKDWKPTTLPLFFEKVKKDLVATKT